MSLRRQQSGIALLTAIILVAIATVLATAIAFTSIMTANRASTVFGADQALLVAEGAEAMEAYAIKQSGPGAQNTSNDQPWHLHYGPFELMQGMSLEAQADDEQGKFNLNTLVSAAPINGSYDDPEAFRIFQNLLTNLGLETKWAALITDWIDPDTTPYPTDGAEDSEYLAQNPQYRPPNQPLTSITELLALPGFGRQRFDVLAPYITALPPGTGAASSQTINICTASARLLDAIIGQTNYGNDPKSLANDRRQSGCVPTMTIFNNILSSSGLNADDRSQISRYVSTSSNFFRLHTTVTIGTARFTLYSLLRRDGSGNIRPIQRTFGTE